LSSYGYDIRVADEFKVFTNINSTVVDPKHFDSRSFRRRQDRHLHHPPNSFALAKTVEYFRIPRDVLTVASESPPTRGAASSSTSRRSSRSGKGFVTLEISNTTPLPPASTPTKASARCSSSRATSRLRGLLRRQEGASIRSSSKALTLPRL
jgi:dCTP deaminase